MVDVQAELFSDIGSRVVIPLMPADAAQPESMPRLKPSVQVNGASYRLITTDIAETRRRGFPNTSAYSHDLMKRDQNSSTPST